MNSTNKWKIVVDPNKKTEISYNITFKQDNVRVFLKAYVDQGNKRIYVDTPIEDSSARQRLIQLAERY